MTLDGMYSFLYKWINYTLNTKYGIGIQIIKGSQNAPKPDVPYVVIHRPPMSNRKVGNTQVLKDYIDDEDDSYRTYSNTWRASINIEEVGSNGRILQNLMNSLEEDDIVDFFEAYGDVSLEDMQAGSANNDITGTFIENRYNFEVFLLYTEKTTIESEIIETVEISDRTYNRGG